MLLSFLFFSHAPRALAIDPVIGHDGQPIDIPDTATVGHVDDPTGHGPGDNIYKWTDPDGTSHWVCSNGNEVVTPPSYVPPANIPPIEIPQYEPPTINNPPEPVCGASCNSDAQCPQNCSSCKASSGGQKICQAPQPTATATPTPAPVCGADCSQNANVCQNIVGCNYCNPASKKCEAAPTATPTATPQPTATPTLTPTPTPPFSEDMCKCDGIENTSLALGQKSTITAYGKVMGDDTKYAKIPNMTFFLYKGNDQNVTIIDQSQPIATTVVSDQPALTRYKASWDLTLASNLDTTATYRIQAKLNCSRKAVALFAPTNNAVMGASTQNPSLLDKIYGFFAGLFAGSKTTPAPVAESPTATPKPQSKGDQLKLGTFRPTKILERSCTFIKFGFQ